MSQEVVRQHEMAKAPPGVIFRQIGGPAEVYRLAEEAPTYLQLKDVIQLFKGAYEQGLEAERWTTYGGFAAFIGADVSKVKRLLNGHPDYMDNLKIRDLLCWANKLQIPLKTNTDCPDRLARQIVQTITQRMHRQRCPAPSSNGISCVGEDDAKTVWRLARKIWYIDDTSSHDCGSWGQWLANQERQILTRDPALRAEVSLPRLVSLGDFLVAWPYLPLFETHIYLLLRELLEKPHQDELLRRSALEFLSRLAEVQELLVKFRESPNGKLEEVARKLRLKSIRAVGFRLERVGLKASDFCGEEAVLGQLVLRSPILRPLFLDLFCHRERGG